MGRRRSRIKRKESLIFLHKEHTNYWVHPIFSDRKKEKKKKKKREKKREESPILPS